MYVGRDTAVPQGLGRVSHELCHLQTAQRTFKLTGTAVSEGLGWVSNELGYLHITLQTFKN